MHKLQTGLNFSFLEFIFLENRSLFQMNENFHNTMMLFTYYIFHGPLPQITKFIPDKLQGPQRSYC